MKVKIEKLSLIRLKNASDLINKQSISKQLKTFKENYLFLAKSIHICGRSIQVAIKMTLWKSKDKIIQSCYYEKC